MAASGSSSGETNPVSRRTSKTIVLIGYGGYDRLRIDQRPVRTPTSGQVLVEIKASGINFAELMARQGTYDRTPKTPAVLGMEGAGIVAEVGPNVTNVKKGERVLCVTDFQAMDGLWSELALIPAQQCFVIPDSMSFEHAGALPINYITAHMMLFEFGNLRPNKSVLVHMAAGGVGVAATQLCKTVPNVIVFGTASESKHDVIKKNGVTHPIDYRSKNYVEEVRKIAPKGVDIVLDPLNGADARKGYNLLKPTGKIIHYGAANTVSGPNRSLWNLASTYMSVSNYSPLFMLGDNKAACGYHMGYISDQPDIYGPVIQELFRLYEAGQIIPIIDSVWKFEDVGKAMARMHDRLNVGKVLISPDVQIYQQSKLSNL